MNSAVRFQVVHSKLHDNPTINDPEFALNDLGSGMLFLLILTCLVGMFALLTLRELEREEANQIGSAE